MVAFFVGDVADALREGQRLPVVLEREGPFEARDAVALDQVPFRDEWLELRDFGLGDARRVRAAGDTSLSYKFFHRTSFPAREAAVEGGAAPTIAE